MDPFNVYHPETLSTPVALVCHTENILYIEYSVQCIVET